MIRIINGQRRYGIRGSVPEDPERCIEGVWETGGWGCYQCSRKRGHGPDGCYCRQHAKEHS